MNEQEIALLTSGLSYANKAGKLTKKREVNEYFVKDVRIRVRVGEFIAVLGEHGSGKTTLGRLLLQEIKPSKGNIFIRPANDLCNEIDEIERRLRVINIELYEKYGKEAETGEDEEREMLNARYAEIAAEASTESKLSLKDKKNYEIRMVPQNIFEFVKEESTVKSFLDNRIIKELKINKEEAVYKRESLCLEIGLPDHVKDKKIGELPTVDIKKVLLALALSVDPDVIILDEFFTQMDMASRLFLIDALRKRMNDRNMSCILLTSDLGTASQFADYVYIMYKGTIIERAKSEEIFVKPLHPFTQTLVEINSTRLHGLSGTRYDSRISIPNSAIKPRGCLYHSVCPVSIKRCGWTADEILEPLKYAIEEQKMLNSDALPNTEKIESDNVENLLEIEFSKTKPFDESNVKTFIENLLVLKSQRQGGSMFEAVNFVDFEQEHKNLVIQLINSYEPFLIEVSEDHEVACHLHPKTRQEMEEETEKEQSREIRFFDND